MIFYHTVWCLIFVLFWGWVLRFTPQKSHLWIWNIVEYSHPGLFNVPSMQHKKQTKKKLCQLVNKFGHGNENVKRKAAFTGLKRRSLKFMKKRLGAFYIAYVCMCVCVCWHTLSLQAKSVLFWKCVKVPRLICMQVLLTAPSADGRTSIRLHWCERWSCCRGTAAAESPGRTGSRCSPPSGCCTPSGCRKQHRSPVSPTEEVEKVLWIKRFTGSVLAARQLGGNCRAQKCQKKQRVRCRVEVQFVAISALFCMQLL